MTDLKRLIDTFVKLGILHTVKEYDNKFELVATFSNGVVCFVFDKDGNYFDCEISDG